eukprot:6291138-Ditylum_brightwellii.AAC.1
MPLKFIYEVDGGGDHNNMHLQNILAYTAVGGAYAVAERLEYSVGSITRPMCSCAPPPRLDAM